MSFELEEEIEMHYEEPFAECCHGCPEYPYCGDPVECGAWCAEVQALKGGE